MEFKIHPTTLILAWIVFALSISSFNLMMLCAVSLLITILMVKVGFSRAWGIVRRTRYLLFVLILVYAFTTPGIAIFPNYEQLSPSREGLLAGGLQAWRLLLLIAALASLMAFLSRQTLLAGIYGLLRPFKFLKVPVERFAVRLWLTLHYAEDQPKTKDLNQRWRNALNLPNHIDTEIKLDVPDFEMQDAIFAFCFVGLIGLIIW